jgi:hypothetical protein
VIDFRVLRQRIQLAAADFEDRAVAERLAERRAVAGGERFNLFVAARDDDPRARLVPSGQSVDKILREPSPPRSGVGRRRRQEHDQQRGEAAKKRAWNESLGHDVA